MKTPIQTPFGKSKVYSASPESPQGTTIVVPGYSESVTHNRGLVDALGRQGLNSFTFTQPRGRGEDPSVDPITRQGDVALAVMDKQLDDGEKVDAVGHSMGAAAVLKAAIKAPSRFSSVTLVQPLGMTEEQGLPELVGRVGKKTAKNQARAIKAQDPSNKPKSGYAASVDTESGIRFSGRVARSHMAGGGTIAKQPILALQEASAAGNYGIEEDLAQVRELGIPVHIVKAHADEMFDTKAVDEGYDRIADLVDSYSSVADPRAGHDTFWMQPERTARIIGELINKS